MNKEAKLELVKVQGDRYMDIETGELFNAVSEADIQDRLLAEEERKRTITRPKFEKGTTSFINIINGSAYQIIKDNFTRNEIGILMKILIGYILY